MIYLSGTARPVDQFGQLVLELDEASARKLEKIEQTHKGRSPRFHSIVGIKFTAAVKERDYEPHVGALATVRAKIRRYSFRSGGERVVGWSLHCVALGAYGTSGPQMRPLAGETAYEDE